MVQSGKQEHIKYREGIHEKNANSYDDDDFDFYFSWL
jgi:hypothetical protein